MNRGDESNMTMNPETKWHPLPCNLWDCIPPPGSQWITEHDLCVLTGLAKGTVSYHLTQWVKQGKIHRRYIQKHCWVQKVEGVV